MYYFKTEKVKKISKKKSSPLTQSKRAKVKPKKKIWLSLNRKMYKQIMALKLALDTTFGYLTYQNFRRSWISNLTYEELNCPPTLSIGLFELKRILLGGLASSVFKGDLPLMRDPLKVVVYNFEDSYDSKSLLPHPQFLGLFNNLVNKLKVLERFRLKGGIGLFDAAKSLSSLSYKSIFNKDREKLLPVLTMGKLISKSFNILPIMVDFESFDSNHPERMLYFSYYHNIDKALRQITFH